MCDLRIFQYMAVACEANCQEAYLEAPSQKRNGKDIMHRREICWKWLVPGATRVYRGGRLRRLLQSGCQKKGETERVMKDWWLHCGTAAQKVGRKRSTGEEVQWMKWMHASPRQFDGTGEGAVPAL